MVNITLKVDASAPIGIIKVFTNGIYIGTLKPGELAVNEICDRLLTPTARVLVDALRDLADAVADFHYDAPADRAETEWMDSGAELRRAYEAAQALLEPVEEANDDHPSGS